MKRIKAAFTLIIPLLGTIASAHGLTDADYLLLYQHSGGNRPAKALNDGLSSKSEAIEFLRTLDQPFPVGDHTLFPGLKGLLLMNLGDRATLEEEYQSYVSAPEARRAVIFAAAFGKITHPEFMVIVARDLDKEVMKGGISNGEGVTGLDVPYANAFVLVNIAGGSGFFSSDVVKWATAVSKEHGLEYPQFYLDRVRAFWAENREKIIVGDYASVRPPGQSQSRPGTEPTALVTSRSVGNLSPSAAKSEPKPTPSEAMANDEKRLWPWFLGLGAVFFIIFAVRRQR